MEAMAGLRRKALALASRLCLRSASQAPAETAMMGTAAKRGETECLWMTLSGPNAHEFEAQ
jgi:hypothetical protein